MEKQRLADPIIKEKKYDTNIISIFLSNTVQLTDPSVMKYDCHVVGRSTVELIVRSTP